MKDTVIKFDFDDILIKPAINSLIKSRYSDIVLPKTLPLFAAPMDTVVDLTNLHKFIDENIMVCLPRTITEGEYYAYYASQLDISFEYMDKLTKLVFISYGIKEIKDLISRLKSEGGLIQGQKILIDVANGHMRDIVDYCKQIKQIRPDVLIMVGNIANPDTYEWYATNECVDYIRVGIGNGGGCWVDGTKIKTKNGLVNIEEVKTDDYVLTHDGKYEKVISTTSYATNEELIEINGEICTNAHEIFVANKCDIKKITNENYLEYCYWIPAKNLNEASHLIFTWDTE